MKKIFFPTLTKILKKKIFFYCTREKNSEAEERVPLVTIFPKSEATNTREPANVLHPQPCVPPPSSTPPKGCQY